MSSFSGDWAELASQHERLLQAADMTGRQEVDRPVVPEPPRWAELASQRERLVDVADPLYGLASSHRHQPGYRLAASAA